MEISTLVFLFFVYAVPTKPVSGKGHETATLSVDERVSFLKYILHEQLKDQLREHPKDKHHKGAARASYVNENYDYVDLSRVAITPINERDERKKDQKYKLRQLKTTTTTTPSTTRFAEHVRQEKKKPFDFAQQTTPHGQSKLPAAKELQRMHKSDKVKTRSSTNHPLAQFYRQRRGLSGGILDTPVQWTHCEDLITPYLTGIKSSMEPPMVIGPMYRKVQRLVHLIKTNVTKYTKQDIYSLMYQFSNIQIRLFSWDPEAIRLLFSSLCNDKRHTFKALKYGIKKLFKDWHLDFSDTKNLLTQSRVFRPLCLEMPQQGSTKSSRATTYKPEKLQIKPKGPQACSDEE